MSCFFVVDRKLLITNRACCTVSAGACPRLATTHNKHGQNLSSILRSICVHGKLTDRLEVFLSFLHGRLRLLLQAGAASFVCIGG